MLHKAAHTLHCNKNCRNTQFFHILFEKCDGKIHFEGNILSRLPKPIELVHKLVLTNFKYQELGFYSRLFDGFKKGTLKTPSRCTKMYEKNNSLYY